MKSRVTDDMPCPNCRHTEGYQENFTYHDPGDGGYMPSAWVTVFCCSLCVEDVAARIEPKEVRR